MAAAHYHAILQPLSPPPIYSLPEHVLDLVFFKLPLCSVFASRGVSKAWYAKLTDPSFLARCSSTPRDPWIVMQFPCPHTTPLQYRYTLAVQSHNKWMHMPLDLPLEFRFLCAKDGLLCFWDLKHHLLIGNPFTKQWKRIDLPPLAGQVDFSIAFLPNSDAGTFKFVVPGKVEFSMYDSSTGLWTVTRPTRQFFPVSKETVIIQDVDYGGHGIYDTEKDLLGSVSAIFPDVLVNSSCARLVQCQGHILLVGVFNLRTGLLSFQQPHLRNEDRIGIWQLHRDPPPSRWELVAQSPHGVAKTMINEADWCFDFSFTSDCSSSIWIFLSESSRLLHYNTGSKQWTLYPGCPIGNKAQIKRDVVSTFSFKMWEL